MPEVPTTAGETCQHECDAGCAIHPSRPARCRQFECVWLQGHGLIDERPDKVGWFGFVIVDQYLNFAAGGRSRGKSVLVVRECRGGVVDEPVFTRRLFDWIEKGSAIVVRRGYGPSASARLYGPKIPRGVDIPKP